MKYLVPSLLILAGAPIFGASIADDLVIKPKVQIQVRAQFGASGTDTGGKVTDGGVKDTSIYTGAAGDTESARFSVRRARFGAEASNSTGWVGVITFRGGERVDAKKNGAVAPSSVPGNQINQSRIAELYTGSISKTFKVEGAEFELHGGLEKPFNAESEQSNSTFILPTDSPVFHFIERRDVGAGIKTTIAEMIKIGVDVQNGNNTSDQDTDSGAPGLFYSGRIAVSPTKELMPAKKMESYYGQEGSSLLIGFDFQKDNNLLNSVAGTFAVPGKDVTKTVTTFGPDINAHYNAISFGGEYRMVTTAVNNSTGVSPEDVKGSLFSVHAGYAYVLENGLVLEPAARFSVIDLDRDNNNGANKGTTPTTQEAVGLFNEGEYRAVSSGREVTFAVNAYWNGHKNKTSLAFTTFLGEDLSLNTSAVAPATTSQAQDAASGASQFEAAKAKVITLQHQILF